MKLPFYAKIDIYCTHYNSLTDFDESSLSISIESPQKVRYRTETLNLGDGLLFYQYRIFSETHTLAIHIRHKGRAIAQSPYQLGPLMHENCACPLRSPVQWLEDFNCPAIQPQIANDLKTFRAKGVNVTEFYDTATEMFSRSSMVHYSIVDGKVSHSVCYKPLENNLLCCFFPYLKCGIHIICIESFLKFFCS